MLVLTRDESTLFALFVHGSEISRREADDAIQIPKVTWTDCHCRGDGFSP